jgi:hypothetical protein
MKWIAILAILLKTGYSPVATASMIYVIAFLKKMTSLDLAHRVVVPHARVQRGEVFLA